MPQQIEFTIRSDASNNNMLRVNLTMPATSISLCATTPTVLDSSQDPCATFLVDLSLGMGIQISDTPGRLLTVTTANITTDQLSEVQDPNLPTEIVQGLGAVYTYLGGPDYQATLVKAIDTNRINVTSQFQKPINQLNATIGGYEQSALTDINQLLQPAASIDRLVHLGLVVQPSGSGQTLGHPARTAHLGRESQLRRHDPWWQVLRHAHSSTRASSLRPHLALIWISTRKSKVKCKPVRVRLHPSMGLQTRLLWQQCTPARTQPGLPRPTGPAAREPHMHLYPQQPGPGLSQHIEFQQLPIQGERAGADHHQSGNSAQPLVQPRHRRAERSRDFDRNCGRVAADQHLSASGK